jgi:hypothetical protein
MRFEVLTVVKMLMLIFRIVALCGPVDKYQCLTYLITFTSIKADPLSQKL